VQWLKHMPLKVEVNEEKDSQVGGKLGQLSIRKLFNEVFDKALHSDARSQCCDDETVLTSFHWEPGAAVDRLPASCLLRRQSHLALPSIFYDEVLGAFLASPENLRSLPSHPI